jgi:hypothetical protein
MRNLHTARRSHRFLAASAFAAAALMTGRVGLAQTCRPLHIDGTAALGNYTYDENGNAISAIATGSGHVSHLGAATVVGMNYFYPAVNGIVRVDGPGAYTAANGDQIWIRFDGTALDLSTGRATGTYVIIGGTGRFTGASGSASFSSSTDPTDPAVFHFIADGILCY